MLIESLVYPVGHWPMKAIIVLLNRYMLTKGVVSDFKNYLVELLIPVMNKFIRQQSVFTKCVCKEGSNCQRLESPEGVCLKAWTKPNFNENYESAKLADGIKIKNHDYIVYTREHPLNIIARFGKDFDLFVMQVHGRAPNPHGLVVINKRWRRTCLLDRYAAWTWCAAKLGLPRDIRRLILHMLVAME